MFAWTQNRNLLPVWLGLRAAFAQELERPEGEAKLKEMYIKWPFFRSFTDLISMVMAKVSVGITGTTMNESHLSWSV